MPPRQRGRILSNSQESRRREVQEDPRKSLFHSRPPDGGSGYRRTLHGNTVIVYEAAGPVRKGSLPDLIGLGRKGLAGQELK